MLTALGLALAFFFTLSHAFDLDSSRFGFGSGLACELAKCLRGTCVNSSSFPFYQCDCDAGWKSPSGKSWLPCIVPNCTFDLTCANTNNSSDVAPPPLFPPFGGGVFDICSLPLCGNGECVHDNNTTAEDQYICKCDDGFFNFRNKPNGYCIHKCSFDADCSNLTIGHSFGGASRSSPPPPQVLSSIDSNQGQDKAYTSWLIILAATLSLMGMYI